jgi:hypothetical protein
VQNKKSQGTPKNTTGRVFSSKLVKANLSSATTLRGQTDPKTRQETVASSRAPERPKPTQQEQSQLVPAPIINNENVDTYEVLTVVQQIMTELNGAVSERG